MNGLPQGPSSWQAVQTDDGKVYYHHPETKATRWDKPPELMDPVEVRRSVSVIFAPHKRWFHFWI